MRRMLYYGSLTLAFCTSVAAVARGQTTGSAATDEGSPDHVVVVRFSEDLFAPVARRVDRQTPVRRTILCTPVEGQCRTTGEVDVDVVANEKNGSFRLNFVGAAHSVTTGRNGPAIIHSRSITRFECTKQVVFDLENGFRSGPTRVTSTTRSRTEGIDSTRGGLIGRVVRRVAWRRVNASRPQSEAISNRLTQQELQENFDQQISEHLVRLNERMDVPKLVIGLLGTATDVETEVSSTHHYLQLSFRRKGTSSQPLTIPTHRVVDAPVEFWAHSSLIDRELPEVLKAYENVIDILTPLRDQAPTLSRVFQRAPRAEKPKLNFSIADGWLVLGLAREKQATQLINAGNPPSQQ